MSAFEELGVLPELIKSIQEDNWLIPTPVQSEAIPLILGGGDVCVAAETGTGKTGAFGLACLQVVYETRKKAILEGGTSSSSATSHLIDASLSLSDKDAGIFLQNNGNLVYGSDDRRWNGVRADVDVLHGLYMFEVKLMSEGLIRVGWSSPGSNRVVGTDRLSFGFGSTGKKSWNSKFDDYGGPFGNGDVIGCAIDRTDTHTISYYKNGRSLGVAYELPKELEKTPLLPTVCGKVFSATCNFADAEFPIPGYAPIGKIPPSDSLTRMSRSSASNLATMKGRKPLCLVLEPTRDLAAQTYECIQSYAAYLTVPEISCCLLIGGGEDKSQVAKLREGVDICVGTQNKVMDHIKRRNLEIGEVIMLVLDEADALIKNDENKSIPSIQQYMKSGGRSNLPRLQTLFFSATLHSEEVKSAISELTHNPIWIDLKGKPTIPDSVHCVVYTIDPKKAYPQTEEAARSNAPETDKVHIFDVNFSEATRLSERIKKLKVLSLVKIADTLKMSSCLIFCRTNVDCNLLGAYLTKLGGGKAVTDMQESGKENPYSCVILAGMQPQQEREKNLNLFKKQFARFLICTDVAARGLDIKELPFLIMMTLPTETDDFFHRVGRVGRADNIGLAVILVAAEKEKVWYHKCSNRGINCRNTKLVEEGGCTIWYDEPAYLKDIEASVGCELERMEISTYRIRGFGSSGLRGDDEEAQSNKRARKNASSGVNSRLDALGTAIYGMNKSILTKDAINQRYIDMLPAIEELQLLEQNIQMKFFQGFHQM